MNDQISPGAPSKHYLEEELDTLFRSGDSMWSFIQQGSLDGVWYWDLEQPDQEWMSPQMWNLLGIDPDTKRHDPAEWRDLIFQEDLEVALENFKKHCADPDHPYDQVVRYRHADGSTVWVRCRGIAIRDASGKPIRMLGAHNDITREKNAEEEAQRECLKSKSANEELANFAYSISHDLKSPSNTIGMILHEIRASDDGGMSRDQQELLDMAIATTTKMGTLVDDMLSYTRLIGQEFTHEGVCLNKVVDGVEPLLAGEMKKTGAVLVVDPKLPRFEGHARQIHLLVQNIVENAIKYRHPDRPPRIEIKKAICRERDKIAFCVSDNGVGIAPEHQERIFELFNRLHREDEVCGAGIGLTACRRVVQNHRGIISVSSIPGEGSAFTVTLPRYCA